MMVGNREVMIKTFPVARKLVEGDFEIVDRDIPRPADGEVLVRVLRLSVEAGQRTHLSNLPQQIKDETIDNAVPAPVPGRVWPGLAVGQVIESNKASLPVGAFVVGWMGWREYLVSDGSDLTPIDISLVPPEAYIGTMTYWGATAYFGLTDVGKIKAGETVVIGAAAGAVGIAAVQIAKLTGCRVVGIAGSDEKVAWLKDVAGADEAINYKTTTDMRAALNAACPEGIDVYFDTVGGEQLEAMIDVIKIHGRIIAAGTLAGYDDHAPVGPKNYFFITPKRLSVQGFTVVDYLNRWPEFQAKMGLWIAEGKVIDRQTVYEGIESAPRAFVDLFKGANIGKMSVRVGEPISPL